VAQQMLGSLTGEESWFAPARSAVLFLVDGLGAIQLRAHASHARHLAQAMPKKHTARTVAPSTTAAALSSLLTGSLPGEHGIVGYSVRDPERGIVANQLSGYEKQGLDPESWQLEETVFERAAARGIRSYSVAHSEYRATGFTRAVQHGSEFVAENDIEARVRVACALATQSEGVLVYCYIPELDKAGHKGGIDSDRWRATLERIDSALRPALSLPRGVGAIVTADHGMIDVPRTRHILLDENDPRLDGVRLIGGEPRFLHLYLDDGVESDRVAEVWRELSGRTADVSTRDEAIADGLFGPAVAGEVRGRLGDVIVAARGLWAFYDDRLSDKRAQTMIGQHGSLTPEETTVPLIRLGAYV
jgi:predicted AlkP superfamily pyrophosphatase or phosphodiesterase